MLPLTCRLVQLSLKGKRSLSHRACREFHQPPDLNPGSAGEAAAALSRRRGIKSSLLKGRRRAGSQRKLLLHRGGDMKRDGWTRTEPAGRVQHRWRRAVVGGRQTVFLLEGFILLYLWVTWLLRRPGNVCSVSVLNDPPLWQLYIHTRWPSYRHLHFMMLLL